VPGLAETPDAVSRVLLQILERIGRLLLWAGLSEDVLMAVLQLFYLVLFAGVVLALVRVRRLPATWRSSALLGVAGALLGAWIVLHRGGGFETALARGDHLLFAGLGGAALRVLPGPMRLRLLVAVSAGMLVLLAGPVPAAIVLAGMGSGFAAQRLDGLAPAARTALVQGALMAATLLACAFVSRRSPGMGLRAQGLFAFMVLRHISWVVDVRRGAGGTLLDYGCYQLFYPCCYGAIERYGDFRARNPEPGAYVDDERLFRAAMRGAVYMWLFFHIPFTLSDLFVVHGWAVFIGGYLLVFVRAALFVMGLWSTLEALALGWGMRIHPNFSGILLARSPSQFWYAWRGTMTRWLVEYVYIPLGGNRAHQTRNVFAVFAVSGAWHCMGMPFLGTFTAMTDCVPIAAWALVYAVVLALALAWRRHARAVGPAAVPAAVRATAAHLGTWVFGGVTATFLAFQGPLVPEFPTFLLRLIGVR
jgi:hypothetical protein